MFSDWKMEIFINSKVRRISEEIDYQNSGYLLDKMSKI